MIREAVLIASGDSRRSANILCEPAQAAMEAKIVDAFAKKGVSIRRGHAFDYHSGHGFIDSQKYGLEVFRSIPNDVPLIVAEAVWQYSHHVLPGLTTHKGPILTVANWSGQWPGLVGMLNLNGSLTKAGVQYSTLWSEDFTDSFFLEKLDEWLAKGAIKHDMGHVRNFNASEWPTDAVEVGKAFAKNLKQDKAIMGVFDEGCMGMFNAIIPDSLLSACGLFKERLSQSALYAKMLTVDDGEASGVLDWLQGKGMTFDFGPSEEDDLTVAQVLNQCKMYIAALRLAHQYGCATIGIQYQLGLSDIAPASDLVEGLLNNVLRPPVFDEATGEELFAGEAMPHFNEVDECAGLDGYVTNRLWSLLGYPPETTLHDLRWGRRYQDEEMDEFVWVFEISGAVPAEHLIDGYAGAIGHRQPKMFFRRGGSTLSGVSKAGPIVWSRVFVDGDELKFDIGLGHVAQLPEPETKDRLAQTTPNWPIMHAVLHGVSRDQMMARHKANHVQVAYAPSAADARKALAAKASAMAELGMQVNICGE
jgi:hypothetical protein